MRPSGLSFAAALALAAACTDAEPAIATGPAQQPRPDPERFGPWAPKPAPHYSKTPRAPLDKDARRAKTKAASKARTAQRLRAKGKR